MNRLRTHCLHGAILLISLLSQPALAQTVTPANPSHTAQTLYQRGVDLYAIDRHEEALMIWEQSVAEGSADAGFVLGQIYEARAVGAVSDVALKKTWYEKALSAYGAAARANHPGALNNLGNLYLEGNGVKADAAKAGEYYRRAATSNNAIAQYNLALILLRQQIPAKALDEWEIWMERAAQQGLVSAQAQLGILLQTTVPKDANGRDKSDSAHTHTYARTRALPWLRQAARAGDAHAQYHYALALQKGWGTQRNLAEAVEWYELASAQNHAAAQLELGRCYWLGLGVNASNQRAREYFLLARANGQSEANDLLTEIASAEANQRPAAKVTPPTSRTLKRHHP